MRKFLVINQCQIFVAANSRFAVNFNLASRHNHVVPYSTFKAYSLVFGSNGFLPLLGFGNLMRMESSRCKDFVLPFQRSINLNSNAVAELWAIREGPRLALDFGYKRSYVHTDSKFVFNVF